MALTMDTARRNPDLVVNAMTPGFIATDITRGMGATKKPEEGTKARECTHTSRAIPRAERRGGFPCKGLPPLKKQGSARVELPNLPSYRADRA